MRDTGTGIAPANLELAFDPFFSTQGRDGDAGVVGTGLGLSVSRSIVMAHGGTIQVDSVLGEGTVFALLRVPRDTTG